MANDDDSRPWWRLHASTWVAVGIVAVGLVLIVVPGQDEMAFKYYYQWPIPYEILEFDVWITHGWPWPYLARGINLPTWIEPAKRPGWLSASGWTFDGELPWFDASNLDIGSRIDQCLRHFQMSVNGSLDERRAPRRLVNAVHIGPFGKLLLNLF